MPRPERFFAALIILAFVASAAAGQARPARASSVCILPVTDLSPAGQEAAAVTEVADRAQRLRAAVCQVFSAAGFQLVAESQWRSGENATLADQDFLDPSRAAAAARTAGAALAVNGSFKLQGDRIFVSISCYDASTGKLKADVAKTLPYNLGIFSALRGQIQDMIWRLTAAPAYVAPASAAPASAAPASAARASTPARAALPAPSVSAAQGSQRAALTKLETEAGWTAGQLIGAGVGFRVYPVPDWIFFCLSFYPYGQAPVSSFGSWLFHLDSEVSVGSYLLFRPDSLFRLGASTGIGLIISEVSSAAQGNPAYTDVYVNILSVWGELNLPVVSFFLRPELKLALGITSPNLLGTSFILVGDAFVPVTLGAVVKL